MDFINEWNKPGQNISSSSSYNIFRNTLLKFVRFVEREIFNINDPFGNYNPFEFNTKWSNTLKQFADKT